MGLRVYVRKLLHRAIIVSKINSFFPKNPFGKKPRADAAHYEKLWEEARSRTSSTIDSLEEQCGAKVDRDWLDNLALYTQVVVKKSDLNWHHGRLLYSLLTRYIRQHELPHVSILETGTARGFSAICMAKALRDSGSSGHITTIDIIPHNAPILWNSIDDAEGRRTRSQLLSRWQEELSRIVFIQGWSSSQLPALGMSRINFAFLDGAHTFWDVINEFGFISKHQKAGDIVVFDDVSLSEPEVYRAVMELAKDSRYDFRFVGDSSKRSYAVAERSA